MRATHSEAVVIDEIHPNDNTLEQYERNTTGHES